jgi:hypothetical protein
MKRSVQRGILEAIVASFVLLLCLYTVFSEAHQRWKTHLPGRTDSRLCLNVLLWNYHVLTEGGSWHDLWQMPTLYPEANMLATSEHLLGESALFAPLFRLTGAPILAFNAVLVLITILNFLSAYFVARRLLRESIPALYAATLFTFSSYRLYQILHLQLWAQFPTPLLFLALIRTFQARGWHWPLLAGFCLAGQFYFGMSLGFFVLLMVGVLLIVTLFQKPGLISDFRFLIRLTGAFAVASILLFPLAVPYRESAQRWGTWKWDGGMAAFMPHWSNWFTPVLDGDATPRSLAAAAERALYLGFIPWLLLLAAAVATVRQFRHGAYESRYSPMACLTLFVVLCCLSVNHFDSYRFLFLHFPGFNGLRVPGRLALLALWPCGLLGGLGLAWLGQQFLPLAPVRRGLLGLAVVLMVFLENYHRLDVLQQYWSDVRCPREEFYAKVVRNLPPGAFAVVPMGKDEPYTVAGSRAAGWRPTLNVYTGRMPSWLPTLFARTHLATTPGQAASLLGEMHLRGIRYLILDKTQLTEQSRNAWCEGRTAAGALLARSIYEDAENQILDLEIAPAEACFIPQWASVSGNPGEIVHGLDNGGDGYLADAGTIAFEPTMPLRPGAYEATFDVETDRKSEVSCEVVRIFLDQQEPPRPDHRREPITLARVSMKEGKPLVEFTVLAENGPEPILQFRVVQRGNGRIRVQRARLLRTSP